MYNDIGIAFDRRSAQVKLQNIANFQFLYSNFDYILNRFPCTDLRPIHTSDRVPWWKRSVSRDSLFFSFAQANIIFHSKEKYEISANKIDVYFSVCFDVIFENNFLSAICRRAALNSKLFCSNHSQENEDDQKVHIGNVLSYERTSKDSKNPTVDRPK